MDTITELAAGRRSRPVTPLSTPPSSRPSSPTGQRYIRPPPTVRGASQGYLRKARAASFSRQRNFIGAIDCGTTSSRFYIFDSAGSVVCSHQLEFEQQYPQPRYHEHDPWDYFKTIDMCITETLVEFKKRGHTVDDLQAVGITTQRETTILWDRQTGKPLYNAIAWPDGRTSGIVDDLRERSKDFKFRTPSGKEVSGEEGLRELTGLPFSTYFSATKWLWLLENVPEVRDARDKGTLMFGTVDSWLLYNYTGGKDGGVHMTDCSNASRTLFCDLETLDWNDSLLEFFEMPREALPEIVSCSEVYGSFFEEHLLGGIRIAGLAGDQQSALVGNKCFGIGSTKQTYGTGCFMLYNTGSNVVRSSHGLLTTVAYKLGPKSPPVYALEGSIAVGGSSIQWLRDNLGIVQAAREANDLAAQVRDTGGVYFVTAFNGLFAPYWDGNASGMMIGLSSFTTKQHIARATLEATCFQTRAILDAMAQDTADHQVEGHGNGPGGLSVLKVDGGMTASDVTMQFQADILGIPVQRPSMRESTVLGAALLAGTAVGFANWDITRPESLLDVNEAGSQTFRPDLTEDEKEWKYAGWKRAIERAKGWRTESGNG